MRRVRCMLYCVMCSLTFCISARRICSSPSVLSTALCSISLPGLPLSSLLFSIWRRTYASRLCDLGCPCGMLRFIRSSWYSGCLSTGTWIRVFLTPHTGMSRIACPCLRLIVLIPSITFCHLLHPTVCRHTLLLLPFVDTVFTSLCPRNLHVTHRFVPRLIPRFFLQ